MIAESFTSSVIGCVIGIGSAAIFLISFQNFISFSLEIPFSIAPPLTLIAAAASTLLFCLAVSGIASLYPTIRIVRSEAYRNLPPGK
jgi:ABC-type antimicrobial peptide transport system permease subunit